MRVFSQNDWFGNPGYFYYLSQNLVGSLGLEGAIDICRENRWQGPLRLIVNDDRKDNCH